MNRRLFLKKVGQGILTCIGLTGGTYYYARVIEPAMLRINKEEIISELIPNSFNDFKIIQFSDTHIGFHYTVKKLNKLVQKINKQEPDLIVFTGDLLDKPQSFEKTKELIQTLRKLHAESGKFWVYGNHDHGGYGTDIVRNIMDEAGFRLLKNNHVFLEKENRHIALGGLDDILLGVPDLRKTLQNVNPNLFTMLLVHEPDYADKTTEYDIDVQLSGHSHGGQVRLPLIGHIYTPLYAEKYIKGKYLLNNGKLKLYVNQGIGTTRLPLRFLCKPEIHSFTLKSAEKSASI